MTRRPVGLGPRLFLAQGLVVVTGALTLLGVTLMLAPGLFEDHLSQMPEPVGAASERHIIAAFLGATGTSLAVAVLASLVTVLAVSWFVTRRVVRPIQAMAGAADRIAGGDYTARVSVRGTGPELEALGKALDQTAHDLAVTERTRAEMLRDVAHELRTPLTALRGYIDALSDGVLQLDADAVRTLHAELARVERLVDDLATVSRAEERRLDLHLRAMAPAQLVDAAVEAARAAYARAGVRLRTDVTAGLPDVRVDQDRIQEVFTNLLDNALRHTAAPGAVTLTGRRSGAGAVELAVADTGDGLAPEHLRRVFERFYRADPGRSRQHGGSGIGLTIARALTEAHGGHIRATSDGPGQGATFTVTLPTTPPTVPPP
ncbi:HAMP domain-containing sensor histidine kinase [Brooklawnia cerclae]|uniref:histidine kinase n=1 Tax=Brooklawnia cerclae TaxID=349934 RepID=A0ABX0SAB5_9ACTN|nr:ATP-binding protein [Brooklawnia cerclae]NIH55369.1 signal transduction histidine kinase [Brooklawnia cerclae]